LLAVRTIVPTDDWLDPTTRANLRKSPPDSQTPAVQTAIDTKGFTLLLAKARIDEDDNQSRVTEVVSEIRQYGVVSATNIALVIAQRLTFDGVTTGQLALSCCDCISLFLPDEIVFDSNADYVRQLSEIVVQSREFETVSVRLSFIPAGDLGRRFLRQFFGLAPGNAAPSKIQAHRKKARLMLHWANKCDVHLEIDTL
jgi:hypothetical protein